MYANSPIKGALHASTTSAFNQGSVPNAQPPYFPSSYVHDIQFLLNTFHFSFLVIYNKSLLLLYELLGKYNTKKKYSQNRPFVIRMNIIGYSYFI